MRRRPAPSTYRLQLTPDFGFDAARELIPYLDDLGVTTLYLSPVFEARPGSPHGYDVIDPTRLRAELGGEDAFVSLAETARSKNLDVLLDIVPNHVATHAANPWWWNLLSRGRQGEAAKFFDVDWDAGGGRIILPTLGQGLNEALREGEIRLDRGSPHDEHEPVARYYDKVFPLNDPPKDERGLLDALQRQHYELAYWEEGLRRINYRRFFDIADLAAVRVEDESVFRAAHDLIARLVRDDLVTGLRIDHIDGLRDPRTYLARLRKLVGTETPIVVEKILAEDECLPDDWIADGTTGYEFCNRLSRLFVDAPGFRRLHADAVERGASKESFLEARTAAKRQVFTELFSAELDRLTSMLAALAGAVSENPPPVEALRTAIIEITAALEVYRTYHDDGFDEREAGYLRHAVEAARRTAANQADADAARAVDIFEQVLFDHSIRVAETSEAIDEFLARWEQASGPVMAKGHEDTALYREVSLASLNEVGGEPVLRAEPIAAFHDAQRTTQPRSLNTTSTHDTKRSEDARLRINVLSELADEWTAVVERCTSWHAPLRADLPGGASPRPADELLIYQSYIAIAPVDEEPDEEIAHRLADYMIKAAREAKVRTNWHEPDDAYESGLRRFVEGLVTGEAGQRFRDDVRPILERAAFFGAVSSIASVVLKATAPGVPDVYRGAELWDLSLVDPDNRRPVDFKLRGRMLGQLGPEPDLTALLGTWLDGRIKLAVTARLLHLRRAHPDLFDGGDYESLRAEGPRAGQVVAFSRAAGQRRLVTVVPRLVASSLAAGEWPIGETFWDDVRIGLPWKSAGGMVDALSDREVAAEAGNRAAVGSILRDFPAAVLVAEGG